MRRGVVSSYQRELPGLIMSCLGLHWKRGQATTSRWRRRQRQHARCAKSSKMGAASPHAFQDGVSDGSECARPAHRRYASEHAGGNMHCEVPEQPSQYRAPPYWSNPATPSSPPLTV